MGKAVLEQMGSWTGSTRWIKLVVPLFTLVTAGVFCMKIKVS